MRRCPSACCTQSFLYGGTDNEDVLRGLGAIGGTPAGRGQRRGLVGAAPAPGGRSRARRARPLAEAISDGGRALRRGRRWARSRTRALDGPRRRRVRRDRRGGRARAPVDPGGRCARCAPGRRAGALLAVSVPNLRFYRLVGNLVLRGEFEYEPWGVRDWTHLRWFTRRSLGRTLRRERMGAAALGEPRRAARDGLLARLSEQLANDFLRQQLTVVARRLRAATAGGGHRRADAAALGWRASAPAGRLTRTEPQRARSARRRAATGAQRAQQREHGRVVVGLAQAAPQLAGEVVAQVGRVEQQRQCVRRTFW